MLWKRRKLAVLLAGAAAYALWRFMQDEEDDQDVKAGDTTAPDKTSDQASTDGEDTSTVAHPEHGDPCAARKLRDRCPSFSVTDENGDDKGALSDARAHAWGWLVDTRPLAPAANPNMEPALRQRQRREANSDGQGAAPRKSVRFRLDEDSMFYGFVFSYQGVCVAHGADASFVGLSLNEVLQRTNNSVDGDELHERFKQAAEEGGEWVSYAWRNTSQHAVQHKGAYIIKIVQWGLPYYAGVGYSLVPPPPATVDAGLYGFICTSEGMLLAHGASTSFVGSTLADVIEKTANTQIDATTLLRRFHAAARLGGGWVTYPWRNDRGQPMRTKGCFVTRLDRSSKGSMRAHGRASRSNGATEEDAAGCAEPPTMTTMDVPRTPATETACAPGSAHCESNDPIALLQAAYDTAREDNEATCGNAAAYMLAGVGYFGRGLDGYDEEDEEDDEEASTASAGTPNGAGVPRSAPPPAPPPVPPSPAAAKAATMVLKAALARTMDSECECERSPGANMKTGVLEAIVKDTSGELAAAAAAATCWHATEMPAALRELLRMHAIGHLRSFHSS